MRGIGASFRNAGRGKKADTITPDLTLDDIHTDDHDALVLTGGAENADKLRMEERAVEIVGEFMEDDKIVAAIGHASWLLIEADVVDEAVVVDGNLITSRKPDDIPAFNQAIMDALEEELAEADAQPCQAG